MRARCARADVASELVAELCELALRRNVTQIENRDWGAHVPYLSSEYFTCLDAEPYICQDLCRWPSDGDNRG